MVIQHRISSFLFALPLAALVTACSQGSFSITDGNACATPFNKPSACAPYGGNNQAIVELMGKDSFNVRSVNFDLSPALPYLKASGRAWEVDPTKLSATIPANTGLIKFQEINGADTTRFTIPMKQVRWLMVSKEDGEAKAMMTACCESPCLEPKNINAEIEQRETTVLHVMENCAFLGDGGITILVLESNIIDPSMRTPLNPMDPGMQQWISDKYPQLQVPTEIGPQYLWNVNRFPYPSTPTHLMYFQPAGGNNSNGDECRSPEEVKAAISSIKWQEACIFTTETYKIEQCDGIVNFINPSTGDLIYAHNLRSCSMKFVSTDAGIILSFDSKNLPDFSGLGCSMQ